MILVIGSLEKRLWCDGSVSKSGHGARGQPFVLWSSPEDNSDDPNATDLAPHTLCADPRSSRHGRSTLVEFSYWAKSGILYFKAGCLPYALSIPIVKLDREFFDLDQQVEEQEESQAIVNLFQSYSARWGCIKYYLATATDVNEGSKFDLDIFKRGVTDHDDHVVETSEHVVSVQMKDDLCAAIDPVLVRDIPRDDSRLWKFFFHGRKTTISLLMLRRGVLPALLADIRQFPVRRVYSCYPTLLQIGNF